MGWRSRRSQPASPSLASLPTEWRLLARISFCSSTWRGRRGSMRASCVTGARLPFWSDGRSPICPCTPYGRHWWLSCSRPCSATVDAPPAGTAPADSPAQRVERNADVLVNCVAVGLLADADGFARVDGIGMQVAEPIRKATGNELPTDQEQIRGVDRHTRT